MLSRQVLPTQVLPKLSIFLMNSKCVLQFFEFALTAQDAAVARGGRVFGMATFENAHPTVGCVKVHEFVERWVKQVLWRMPIIFE